MNVAIMQPYFLPYLGYFQLLNAVDKFVFYDDVNYIRQGWINRNRILVQGQPFVFSIPVSDQSSFRKIMETKLTADDRWKSKLLKTIELSYGKAEFFIDVMPIVTEMISLKTDSISELAKHSVIRLQKYLGIETTVVETSAGFANDHLKGVDRIIEICRQMGASQYLNLPGGEALYDRELFTANHIALKFIRPKLVEYNQSGSTFVPGLSILDVVMHNSRDRVREMVNDYGVE